MDEQEESSSATSELLDTEIYQQEEVKSLSFPSLLAITVGFGTDAYIIFVMNVLLLVLTEEYPSVSSSLISLVTTSVLVGAIVGQIMFGQLADRYGRTKMFMITMGIIGLFSALSAGAPKLGGEGVFVWLAVARFFLGLGIISRSSD